MNETLEQGIERLADQLASGLRVQARRDAITKLGRQHGIKVEWGISIVHMRVGGQAWSGGVERLDFIEAALNSAIEQVSRVGQSA